MMEYVHNRQQIKIIKGDLKKSPFLFITTIYNKTYIGR